MRVLVCGGRDFADSAFLWNKLSEIEDDREPITLIIHGAARGADSEAELYARTNHIKQAKFPANWKKHGKAAGPLRNQRMIEEGKPDLVVAFPGGKGTADMVRRARVAGLEVIEVRDTLGKEG